MQKSDLKIIQKFKELISRKVKVHEVRVFGSRARGTNTTDSDLDVLVVVEHLDREVEKYISDCAWEAGFSEDIVIVPVILSRDTLEYGNIKESAFIRNVYNEGIIV